MLDMEDNRSLVIDSAIENGLGTKEEIDLYEELSIALELIDDNNFDVIYSGIGGGVDFGITTPYPNGLPETVGTLFFNVNSDFDVKVEETASDVDINERYFRVHFKTKLIEK